jgi:hypothetical protein
MIPLMLWYSHDQSEGDVARTHEELDAILDKVAALSGPDWPALAEVTLLENTKGPMLGPGFLLGQGAIYYSGHDYTNGNLTLGEGPRDGEPLLYMMTTSDNEFPPNSEIPVELVRRATHEFAETGVRPTCVEWQTWDRSGADTESEFPEV